MLIELSVTSTHDTIVCLGTGEIQEAAGHSREARGEFWRCLR